MEIGERILMNTWIYTLLIISLVLFVIYGAELLDWLLKRISNKLINQRR